MEAALLTQLKLTISLSIQPVIFYLSKLRLFIELSTRDQIKLFITFTQKSLLKDQNYGF